MNNWKDETKRDLGDKPRSVSSSSVRVVDVHVCVHRYTGYPPDCWFLTCEPFFKMKELLNKDVEEAKVEALGLLAARLKITMHGVDDILNFEEDL